MIPHYLNLGFALTLEASVYASALIALLLLFRPWLKQHITPRWFSLLWMLVIFRLLFLEFPALPGLSVSPLPDMEPAMVQTFAPVPAPAAPNPVPAAAASAAWLSLLAWLWLGGMAVVAASSFHAYWRWTRVARRAVPVEDEAILMLLESCRGELRLSRQVELRQLPGDLSPCVTGLFHPRLLISQRHLESLDRTELRWIFLHELVHVQRGDLAIQIAAWGTQVLHWFNPLVWMMASCIRHDRELACDVWVTELENPDNRHHYGKTLLKIAEGCPESPWTPGFLGITEESASLKDRIHFLFNRKPVAWGLAAFALIALSAGVLMLPPASGKSEGSGSPAAKGPNYYHMQFVVVQLHPMALPKLKEALRQGGLEHIEEISNLRIYASPETHVSSGKFQSLTSGETISYVADEARGTQNHRNCNWSIFFSSTEPHDTLQQTVLLSLNFTGTGVMHDSRQTNGQPRFSEVAFPFDGVVSLGSYQLLGTTDLTVDPALKNSDAQSMFAFIVKADRVGPAEKPGL